jgi:hypothetical protein
LKKIWDKEKAFKREKFTRPGEVVGVGEGRIAAETNASTPGI